MSPSGKETLPLLHSRPRLNTKTPPQHDLVAEYTYLASASNRILQNENEKWSKILLRFLHAIN